MGRRKSEMLRPEEMGQVGSAEDRLAIRLTKVGTKQAIQIRDRMMKDYINDALSCEVETENGEKESVMNVLTKNWFNNLMEHGVTSKDMLAIMKLRGEDVQRSQSVSLKIKAEAKAEKDTEEFLKSAMDGEIEEKQ